MIRRMLAYPMLAACAWAASTATWEMNTFGDFVKGRFAGISLSRDGRMTLAPKLEPLFASEQPAIWSVAQGKDGSLYVGTGHRGRVYQVPANGKASPLWSAPEPEIFAMTTGPDGAVYAGTSPDGKVYRIEGGRAAEYFNPASRYIWGLQFGSDGALYVATGDQGKIFRVTKAGAGELWYETGQQHVTALALDSQARLLAGTEPNGILYRINGKDQAFVLYDAALPEIRTVVTSPNGEVYAAALGGSVAQKVATAASLTSGGTTTVTAPPTTITVTEESAAQAGIDLKPKPPETAKAISTITPGTTVYVAPQAAEATGVEKSAIYRINPDNTVETVWSSKDENIYDLSLGANHELVFSTDQQGRIYRLTPDRRLTLLVQTNEGETTRLIASGDSLIASTNSSGKLLRLGGSLAPSGQYDSPVHDAGSVAKWGQLSWRGARSTGTAVAFRTRSGNSARPDRTWSEWSMPVADPSGSAISSPNARYIQWRTELAASGSASPSVTGVTLSYLPQNNPPAVRSINVTTQIVPANTSRGTAASTTGAYTVTVTDTGESAAATSTGTPAQTVSRGLAQQIQLTWVADDPDGDRLSYSVWFRGEEETEWKLLRANMAETTLTIEGDVLADGKYLFRVLASDRQSNSAQAARTAELISPPVIFDSTPPVVSIRARRNGSAVEVEAEASDSSSALRRAEYALDAAGWVPLDATDGVIDGQQERFVFRLENITSGEHVVVVRVFDSSNNSGLAKVVVPRAQ